MTIWQWLDKHGPSVGAFVGTIVIGVLLWARIGDVSDDVRSLRDDASAGRTADVARIDGFAGRLDNSSARLDTLIDTSKKTGEGIDQLLASSAKQNERLDNVEKIVATGATDMSVVLRLMTGTPTLRDD